MPDMMTGHARRLRRRRHGAGRPHRHRRRSVTARRPRAISTPGCAAGALSAPPSIRSCFDQLKLPIYADAPRSVNTNCRSRMRLARLRRNHGRIERGRRRITKRSGASPAAIASNATTALPPARRRRSSSSARPMAIGWTWTCAPAVPCVSSSARATRWRWSPKSPPPSASAMEAAK